MCVQRVILANRHADAMVDASAQLVGPSVLRIAFPQLPSSIGACRSVAMETSSSSIAQSWRRWQRGGHLLDYKHLHMLPPIDWCGRAPQGRGPRMS